MQMGALNHWMKSATAEAAKNFTKKMGSEMFHCTVGKGDILSLPAGYVFCEKVVGASDYGGIRIPILSMTGMAALTQIKRHLIIIDKPSEILSRSVDALALAE